MLDTLNRLSLPAKYALIALLGGLIYSVLALLLRWQLGSDALVTLIGLSAGGYIGGWIRQRRGKTR
jgi:hypothetical protein